MAPALGGSRRRARFVCLLWATLVLGCESAVQPLGDDAEGGEPFDADPSDLEITQADPPDPELREVRPDIEVPPPAVPPLGIPTIHTVEVELSADDWALIHQDPLAEVEVPAQIAVAGVGAPGEFELHGGFARTVAKKSYRVRLSDATPLALFGEAEWHQRFVLQAAWIDPTWLRNPLTFGLVTALGGLAPRVSFAELFVRGEYEGLYQIIERVDEHYLDSRGLSRHAQLYKADTNSANWKAKVDPMSGFNLVLGDAERTADLAALFNATTYTPATLTSFQENLEPLLDLEDFARWQRVMVLAGNRDSYTKNYYHYHAGGAPFRLVAWDCDATWGVSWDGEPSPPDSLEWHGYDAFSPRLFSIPEYRERHVQASGDLLAGVGRVSRLGQSVRAAARHLEAAAARDAVRWPGRIPLAEAVATLSQAIEQRAAALGEVLEGLAGD